MNVCLCRKWSIRLFRAVLICDGFLWINLYFDHICPRNSRIQQYAIVYLYAWQLIVISE